MANVLESLVIQLGLDTKGVSSGANKADQKLKDIGTRAKETGEKLDKGVGEATVRADKAMKALGVSGGDAGKALADGFSKARNQALALMAVFTAGRSIKAFVQQTTEANAQLGYAAERLNTNPQQLWAANHDVMAMGGGEQEVTSALGNIQQMQTTPEGAARLANIMGQLGVRDYQQDIRNGPEALLRDINRVTQGMDQGRKNNLLGQLGFGPGMINTVDQTTASFDKLIASKNGLAPTNSEIANSQKLMADLREFADVNDHFARVLENEVAPAIDKIVVGITKWEQQNPDLVKDIQEITIGVVALGTALTTIGAAKGALSVLGLLRGGAAVRAAETVAESSPRIGLGLLGRAGIAGAAAAELWHPTDAGGSVEKWALHTFGNPKAQSGIRWFFGDKTNNTYNTPGDAQQAVKILTGMGFSQNAALGIAGNISQESGFNPDARGDNGSAVGLGQWHKDRAAQILRETGIDVRSADFADQVKAYGLDLQRGSDAGSKRAYRELSDPNATIASAVHSVRKYYERPADAFGNEDTLRYNRAIQIAQSAGNTTNNSTSHSVEIGHITVNAGNNADGQKIARSVSDELRKSLPIQNLYGQA